LKGSGTEKAFVMPCGKHRSLGMPFPLLSTRALYTASPDGWNSTSTPAAMPSGPPVPGWEPRGRRQIPDRSGFPSGVRGTGAVRSGLPSGVRGAPGCGTLTHCATAGDANTHTAARQIVSDRFFRVFIQPIAMIAPLELDLNVDPCQAPTLDLVRDEPL
jgi:hypothetical protein